MGDEIYMFRLEFNVKACKVTSEILKSQSVSLSTDSKCMEEGNWIRSKFNI
jgi:hypothetical protein